MILTKEQLQKVQMIQQEMLDKFVCVCVKNELKHYLIGGTLLGAVRHNGPIPWDDDIDVAMPIADRKIDVMDKVYTRDLYFRD